MDHQEEHKYEQLTLRQFNSPESEYEKPSLPSNSSKNVEKSKQSAWNTPFIVLTVLLCLIVMLLVAILCLILVQMSARDTTSTSTTTGITAGNSRLPNFTEWVDGIACKVNTDLTKGFPNFTEWADRIVHEVNTDVIKSFPNFTEWSVGVAHIVYQLLQSNPNFTEPDERVLQSTKDLAEKLIHIVNTLSNLQDTSTSTNGVVDDILLVAQKLIVLQNASTALPNSCKEIKETQAISPSGVYLIAPSHGISTHAYCNMGTLCNSGGGWTRLAHLDMSDATENCPAGFKLHQSGNVRACGRPANNTGSCISVQFPSNGISYSQVCGRVVGYQHGTPNAFEASLNNLNSHYVDGVSITRGNPRQHVWTLAGGLFENSATYPDYQQYICPCATGSSQSALSFVGSHYFCESANPSSSSWTYTLYTSDPLWDGSGCGSLEASCCSAPGIPWFHRDYGSTTTTDYLELRICGNQDTGNEDTPVSYYEIYVK